VTVVPNYHEGKAACIVSWNGRDMVLDCATTRKLAKAMFTAAAVAEVEAGLVAAMRELGGFQGSGADETAATMLQLVREKRGARPYGDRRYVTFVPGVSLFDRRPFVHANCRPYEPQRYNPDELRGMANNWYEVANAAEHDAILRYVLAEVTDLSVEQTQRVFDLCRNLRPTGLHDDDGLVQPS
jgi:hypothetical protein